jgi:shikimate kinase
VTPVPVDADRIILIGFMGSGKTSVGRVLAARLGWELVDTDALVETRAGALVADVFREKGEAAFRELEAEALASLRGRRNLVIATGGGAPTQARNRDFFVGQGVFHLRVSLENVLQRTRGDRERPLLSQGEEAVRALYESRRPVYESMGTGVDTDGRDPAAIAGEILRLLNPTPYRKPAGSG